MKSKNLIYTGLLMGGVLIVPTVMIAENVEASSTTHKVKKGDTFYKLSKTYGTTVNNLKQLNGLKSDKINVGQILKVKAVVNSKPVNGGAKVKVQPKKLSNTNSTTTTAKNVTKILSDAQSLKDTKYIWGGTTTRGFDCSGFVQHVYKKSGINLPRTAAEMSKQGTTINSKSQLRAGDLVLFATGATKHKITHVGIYIGNNKVIHATTSNGVSISGINDTYWGNKFIKGQRIL